MLDNFGMVIVSYTENNNYAILIVVSLRYLPKMDVDLCMSEYPYAQMKRP